MISDGFNSCCQTHDACYERQEGQQKCDDEFCTCLATATIGTKKCLGYTGPAFCYMVRKWGEKSYNGCSPANGGCSPMDTYEIIHLLSLVITINNGVSRLRKSIMDDMNDAVMLAEWKRKHGLI